MGFYSRYLKMERGSNRFMDDSYFYTFKMHFEWEDREKEMIICRYRLNNEESILDR